MPALIEMLIIPQPHMWSASCNCKQRVAKSCWQIHMRMPETICHLCSKSPVMTASMYALSVPLGVGITIGCLSCAALKSASKVPPEKRGTSLLSVLPIECSLLVMFSLAIM